MAPVREPSPRIGVGGPPTRPGLPIQMVVRMYALCLSKVSVPAELTLLTGSQTDSECYSKGRVNYAIIYQKSCSLCVSCIPMIVLRVCDCFLRDDGGIVFPLLSKIFHITDFTHSSVVTLIKHSKLIFTYISGFLNTCLIVGLEQT